MVDIGYVIWAVFRAIVVVSFIYECYTVGEEIAIAAKEESFNVSQTFVMATHMYDKNEVAFFITFFIFTVAIWFV